MIFLKDEDRPDIERDVVIAALCAAAAALATWAVEEIRDAIRQQRLKESTHEKETTTSRTIR